MDAFGRRDTFCLGTADKTPNVMGYSMTARSNDIQTEMKLTTLLFFKYSIPIDFVQWTDFSFENKH